MRQPPSTRRARRAAAQPAEPLRAPDPSPDFDNDDDIFEGLELTEEEKKAAERAVMDKLITTLKESSVNGLGDVMVFNKAEGEVLQEWARIILAIKTVGVLAGSVKSILLWLGIVLTAITAFRAGLLDWLGLVPK